jgi:pyruvate,orthophosphate dikinase
MQTRAILDAAAQVRGEGIEVFPEIMIPLAMARTELERMRAIVASEIERESLEREPPAKGEATTAGATRVSLLFGTMIELPRAALLAGDLAQTVEFFSFGTNDLTQATLGLSRDDAGKFLPAYVDSGILPKDPFVSLDREGVGALVTMAVERGRRTRPGLKVGICGEHGGDPPSIEFFQGAGLDYVSCSPFRIPIARLAAAQAALRSRQP